MNDRTTDLDATGLRCPLPVLRARKALKALAAGDVLRVTATDPAAPADFRAFCTEAGHVFVDVAQDGDIFTIRVRRG